MVWERRIRIVTAYYTAKLAAERLRQCYEIAPPRVQRYLEAEIAFVLEKISPSDAVLELGCGYGRALQKLLPKARFVAGIDTSRESLLSARKMLGNKPNCYLLKMNAVELGFRDHSFDAVICIQNGISAFKVDRYQLIREAVRVTRPGGKALFSSYSEQFWEDRLTWFRLQAAQGLIGEIDEEATGNGVIVCKDGFKATTIGAEEFRALALKAGVVPRITEVDGSSIFCEIDVKN